jgi:hypothetical protein
MICDICDNRSSDSLLVKAWIRHDKRWVGICAACGAYIAQAFGFVRHDSTIVPPVDRHRPTTEPAPLSELVPIVMRDLEQAIKRSYALDTARTTLVEELGLLIDSETPSDRHMAKHMTANAIIEVARQVAIVIVREHIDHQMQELSIRNSPTSVQGDPVDVLHAEDQARRACE